MTDRQREVLSYLAQHIRAFGAPPTIREICTAMGLTSTNGVNDHLNALERKGCLVRRREKTRSVQLTETGWKAATGGDLVQTFELTLEEYVAEQLDAWKETLGQHGVPESVDDVSAYIEARTEAVQEHAASAHRVAVIDAWHTGCVVPERVLADYPELRGAA